MIDTIVLRIHNLKKNQKMVQSLENQNHNRGYETIAARANKKALKKLREQGITDEWELLDILKRKGKLEYLIKTKFNKHMKASSHYQLAYYINYSKDFIEFNFSIPKYIFGSNVVQFVDHLSEKGFVLSDSERLEHNMERTAEKLQTFIHSFFRSEFQGIEIDAHDIEVNRIDLCFNQVFRSKGEALHYLSYQKRRVKKYSRETEEGTYRDHATGIMYASKRYGAKIYHKGTEYAKNDRKEHEKIIGDKAYDSDPLDERLAKQGIKVIAPHKANRKKKATQDGHKLRRYKRRWKIKRFFAWLQNYRRCVVRYENKEHNFKAIIILACIMIFLKSYFRL